MQTGPRGTRATGSRFGFTACAAPRIWCVLPSRIGGQQVQRLVDKLVHAIHEPDHGESWPEYLTYTLWCDREGVHADYIGDIDLDEHAFTALRMSALRPQLNDRDLRETLDLDDDAPVTNAQRLAHLLFVVENALELGNDDVRVCLTLPISSREGKRAEVGLGYWGGGPGPSETEWFGVYENVKAFRAALRARGFVTDLEELAKAGDSALRYWSWVD